MTKQTYAISFNNGQAFSVDGTHMKVWDGTTGALVEVYDGKEVVAAFSNWSAIVNTSTGKEMSAP